MIKFENTEEATGFYLKWSVRTTGMSFADWCLENGYIKKTPLEETRDEYYRFACGSLQPDAITVYIKELENEIIRLKGEEK